MPTTTLPPAIRLGLEFRRRGLAAPGGLDGLVDEFSRRGLLEDAIPQATTTLPAAETDDQDQHSIRRKAYVDQRVQARLNELTRLEAQRRMVLDLPDDTDPNTINAALQTVQPSYTERAALYRSLPEGFLEAEEQRFADEFDRTPDIDKQPLPDASKRTPLSQGNSWLRDFSNAAVRSVVSDIPAAVQEMFGESDQAHLTRERGAFERPTRDNLAATAGGITGSLGMSALALVQPELWPVVLGHAALMGAGGMGEQITAWEKETGQKVNPATAAALMTGAGVTAYLVENLQIKGLEHVMATSMAKAGEQILAGNLKAAAKFLAVGSLAGGVTEGTEEFIEGRVGNALQAAYNPDKRSIAAVLDGSIQDFMGGFAGGALLGGPAVLGGTVRTRKAISAATRSIEAAQKAAEAQQEPAVKGPPKVEPGPDAGAQPPAPPAPVYDDQGKPKVVYPKVIPNAKSLRSWYSRTYSDQAGSIPIEVMANDPQNRGRFRLIDIPPNLVDANSLQEGDINQEKIKALGALSVQEVNDLPPIIAVASADGRLIVADGAHRVSALQGRSDIATVKAYVPEAIAKAILDGSYVAGKLPGPAPAEPQAVEPTSTPTQPPSPAGPTPVQPAGQPTEQTVTPPAAPPAPPAKPAGKKPTSTGPKAAVEPWSVPRAAYVQTAANTIQKPADFLTRASVFVEGLKSANKDLLEKKDAYDRFKKLVGIGQVTPEQFAQAQAQGQIISDKEAYRAQVVLDRIRSAPSMSREDLTAEEHRQAVEDAVKAGKRVPPEVLADYPELAPKGKTQPKKTKPEQEQPGKGSTVPVDVARTKEGLPIQTEEIPVAGKTLLHFTTEASAKSLLAGEAYDAKKSDNVHLTGKEKGGWGGEHLYLSLDESTWATAYSVDETIPETELPSRYEPTKQDATRFDYKTQKWMIRKGGRLQKALVGVPFKISPDANIVTIGAAKEGARRVGVGLTPQEASDKYLGGVPVDFGAEDLFDAMKAAGVDVVVVQNAKEFGSRDAGVSGWHFFNGATFDQAVILNQTKVSVSPPSPQAAQRTEPAEGAGTPAPAEPPSGPAGGFNAAAVAEKLGIRYDGTQTSPGRAGYEVFTDPKTGSTFYIRIGDDESAVQTRLEQMRAEFAAAAAAPVTPREYISAANVEQVEKGKWTVEFRGKSASVSASSAAIALARAGEELAGVKINSAMAAKIRKAVAVARAYKREYELGRRDPLTGVYNRLGGENAIKAMVERGRYLRKPVAIFGIDLVLFKQLNDSMGHARGDQALVGAADAIKSAVRNGADGRAADVAAIVNRRGGDEFEVAVWNVTDQQAIAIGERMQAAYTAAMDKLGIELPNGLKTALGFGFSIIPPGGDVNLEEARNAADDDLDNRKTALKQAMNIPAIPGRDMPAAPEADQPQAPPAPAAPAAEQPQEPDNEPKPAKKSQYAGPGEYEPTPIQVQFGFIPKANPVKLTREQRAAQARRVFRNWQSAANSGRREVWTLWNDAVSQYYMRFGRSLLNEELVLISSVQDLGLAEVERQEKVQEAADVLAKREADFDAITDPAKRLEAAKAIAADYLAVGSTSGIGRSLFDKVLAILDDAPAKYVETGDPNSRLLLYDLKATTKHLSNSQAKAEIDAQESIRKDFVEGVNWKLPNAPFLRKTLARSRVGGPQKISVAADRPSLWKFIGSRVYGQNKAQKRNKFRYANMVWVDPDKQWVMASDGYFAVAVKDQAWTPENAGLFELQPNGQLGGSIDEAAPATDYASVFAQAKSVKPEQTISLEVKLVDLLRFSRQASIMTMQDGQRAKIWLNQDGSLGLATAHPEFGFAELNIYPGAQPVGFLAPSTLRNMAEVMLAGGVESVSIREAPTEMPGRTIWQLVGSGAARTMFTLVVMDKKADLNAESNPTKPKEPQPAYVKQPGEEEDAGEDDVSAMPAPAGPMPPPKGTPPAAAPMANTGRFTNDINPLNAAEGKFRRTARDRLAKISADTAHARAVRDGGEARQADTVYQIISDLSRRFNLGTPGIARAKILKRYALGFYTRKSQAIRLRFAGAAGTFAHELGHHLHNVLFVRRAKPDRTGIFKPSRLDFPKEWRQELTDAGKALYGKTQPAGGYAAEGWAEFVRLLVTAPIEAKKSMPTVYAQAVEALITHHPETWASLVNARVRLINAVIHANQDPIDQFVAHDRPPTNLNRFSLWDDIKARLFDRFARLQTMIKDLGKENIGEDKSPYVLALRANGHISGDIKIMLDYGTFDPADAARESTGKGLVAILEPVKNSLRLWQNYMVARRVLEKRAQGLEPLPQDPMLPRTASSDRLRAFIAKMEEAHPEFATAAKDFQDFNSWLIKRYAVHYGLITPEAADLIVAKNLEYITFRHLITEDALAKTNAGSSRGGFAGKGSGIKRFRAGYGEQIFPPIESFVASLQGIVSNARLNEVARAIVTPGRTTAGLGRWIQTRERPMEGTKVSPETLSDEVRKQLGIFKRGNDYQLPPWMDGMDEGAISTFLDALENLQQATFWKPGNRTDFKNREFSVLIDGKPQFFEAKDARLYQVLQGLGNPYTAHLVLKILSVPGRTIRAGATQLNPSFFIPNFMRDLTQALTMTESDMLSLSAQARGRLRGLREAFMGGDLHRLFLASGADMSGLFGEYYNPKTARINFEKMFAKPHLKGLVSGNSPAAILKDIVSLGLIDRLNRAFELSTRLGEFAVAMEESAQRGDTTSLAVAKAGQRAADITLDFQRGGSWSKEINQVVPFFNAAMLGIDKLRRFIARDPLKALGRIFTLLIVPSLVQLILNLRNEDYWAKPLGDRDRHWFIPTGLDDHGKMTYVKIPKPYGLGIFSIATERSFAYLFGIDPETGRPGGDPGAFREIGQNLIDEMRPTLNIAGLMPLVEVSAGDLGWSFYQDRTIVPRADEAQPRGEQGADRSSDLARILGRWMDYPPAKVDYLISGWFGGLGRDAVRTLADPVIRSVDPDARKGEPIEFSDWLVVRRFLAGHTRSGHEAITRFFDTYDELGRVHAGLNRRQADPASWATYARDHATELDMYPAFSEAQERMGQSFSELRALYRQRGKIDPDTLESQINRLYDSIISDAREALRAKRNR